MISRGPFQPIQFCDSVVPWWWAGSIHSWPTVVITKHCLAVGSVRWLEQKKELLEFTNLSQRTPLLKGTLDTKWEDLKKLFIVTIASINAQCYKCPSLKAWHPPHTDFMWLWHITVTHARNQCVCSKTGENDISGGQQQRWSFALEYIYLKNVEIIHCIWKQWLLERLQAKKSSVHIKSGEMYSSLGFNIPFAPFAKLKNACKVMLWIHLLKARRKSFHYQGKPAESWPTKELLPCSATSQQAMDCSYIPGSPCAARVWQNTLQFMLNIPHTQWLKLRAGDHHKYMQEVFFLYIHTHICTHTS